MSFRLIAAEKAHHPVFRLARVLGVSRPGFYAWASRQPSAHARCDAELAELIRRLHAETDGIYGAPCIHAELAEMHGIHVSRKRVAAAARGRS